MLFVFVYFLLLILSDNNIDATGLQTVLRCAELNSSNPLVNVCKVKKRLYHIQGMHSHKNTMFREYKATTGDDFELILIMGDRQFEEQLLRAYNTQHSLFKQFNQTVSAYHMVNYYDRSEIKDNDVSIVIVKKYFKFDSLQLFIKHALVEMLNSSMDATSQERFAMHESIQLINHVAKPLELISVNFGLSYGVISMDKICVKSDDDGYGSYFLSGLEDFIPSRFWVKKTVSDLIWIAWHYYVHLCHTDVLLYLNELDDEYVISKKGDNINTFCFRSKELYYGVISQSKDIQTGPFPLSLQKQQNLAKELVSKTKETICDNCIEYLFFALFEQCGSLQSMTELGWHKFHEDMDQFASLLPLLRTK